MPELRSSGVRAQHCSDWMQVATASGALYAQLDAAPEEDTEAADELANQQVRAHQGQRLSERALRGSLGPALYTLCGTAQTSVRC